MTPNRWKKDFNAIGINYNGKQIEFWQKPIKKKYIYAEEADVLNVALFGITAKEWRTRNPELAKDGNIRDYTDLIHLIILNNLENINAELIELGMSREERLIRLNVAAKNKWIY